MKNKFIKAISEKWFLTEMTFIIGIIIIIFTNFLVNLKFGLYSLGLLLIALAIVNFYINADKKAR